MGYFGYLKSIRTVTNDKNARAYFTASDVVNSTVDLWNARMNLSAYEYNGVNCAFQYFKSLKEKEYLNFEEFLTFRLKIVAHFDLIAPFYKFCGNSALIPLRTLEYPKDEYREEAQFLIDQGDIFSDEWYELHKRFYEKFYEDETIGVFP